MLRLRAQQHADVAVRQHRFTGRQLDLVQPIPTPSSCADFKWNITEQTGNTAKGSFSATCANDLKLTGTAQGTITGSTIEWSANAVGNAAGLTTCQVSLKGTAEIGVTTVRVPYSGDTCLGKVSGVESLSRR